MKKNLCLLIYELDSGGAERVLAQWSELLQDEYNVFLTLYNKYNIIAYNYGVVLVFLDAKSNNRSFLSKVIVVLKRMKLLRRFVKEKSIDMVISFCNECNLVNTLSFHRAKKICSIRSDSDLDTNRYVKIVLRSNKNRIIVQTETLKSIIAQRFGNTLVNKIDVIGNPFNVCAIQHKMKEEPDNDYLSILKSHKTITNVASFKTEKNHAHLLKVFNRLCKESEDIYLFLIGPNN